MCRFTSNLGYCMQISGVTWKYSATAHGYRKSKHESLFSFAQFTSSDMDSDCDPHVSCQVKRQMCVNLSNCLVAC